MLLGGWLRLAAPGGALLALLAGGLFMSAIGMCYAELAARMPRAGGELRYALETLGPKVAFTVGWFLTLFLVAICAFEGTALAWLSSLLLPARHPMTVYHLLGEAVTGYDLAVGCGGAAVTCALNLSGLRVSVLIQRLITYSFIALMAALIVAGLVFGDVSRLQPLFSPPEGKSWLLGSSWIFATCAMLLYGFQTSLYLIEERAPDVDVRAATMCMVFGIIVAAAFYAAVVLSACSIVPWRSILVADLPSVAAFDALYPGGMIKRLILIVAIFSLGKTWNAIIMMASRLVLAQSQAALLPAMFGRLDVRGRTPTNAILLVTGASIMGIFLGRGAIVPIVNMATICVSMVIVLMVIALAIHRRREPSPGFSVPAGSFTVPFCLTGAALMAAFALFQPLWLRHGIPLEWKLIALWAALGLGFRSVMRTEARCRKA